MCVSVPIYYVKINKPYCMKISRQNLLKKTVNLSLVFTENQHLTGFSPIMKYSFSMCCDFKTFHFEIDHLKIILIKNIYPLNFIDSCITYIYLKLWFQMYLKEMLLLSCRSWQVLQSKFGKSFKHYLVIN